MPKRIAPGPGAWRLASKMVRAAMKVLKLPVGSS
jgi:hypothetical protein